MTTVSPAQPWWRSFTRHHWFVFTVASLAWLFDCMDQQFFNLARDAAMEDLLGDKARATVAGSYSMSVFLVGWAIGGLVFGSLGDRYGRARILSLCVLLYSVFTGLSSFSTGFIDFCVYRFLTGLGVGGVFGLSVALVADSVPDHTRAPALGMLQSFSTWGNVAAGVIGMGIGAGAGTSFFPNAFTAMMMMSSTTTRTTTRIHHGKLPGVGGFHTGANVRVTGSVSSLSIFTTRSCGLPSHAKPTLSFGS